MSVTGKRALHGRCVTLPRRPPTSRDGEGFADIDGNVYVSRLRRVGQERHRRTERAARAFIAGQGLAAGRRMRAFPIESHAIRAPSAAAEGT